MNNLVFDGDFDFLMDTLIKKTVSALERHKKENEIFNIDIIENDSKIYFKGSNFEFYFDLTSDTLDSFDLKIEEALNG